MISEFSSTCLIVKHMTNSFCIEILSRCILDGEMLVWDTSLNRFAEFGSNQEIGAFSFTSLSHNFSPYHPDALIASSIFHLVMFCISQRRQQEMDLTVTDRLSFLYFLGFSFVLETIKLRFNYFKNIFIFLFFCPCAVMLYPSCI